MKTDNELIAEFMDEEISAVIANYGVPVRVLVLPRKPISETRTGRPIEAKYDTSWDWLMSVVAKIKNIPFASYKYDFTNLNIALTSASLWTAYIEVVEFIKSYSTVGDVKNEQTIQKEENP